MAEKNRQPIGAYPGQSCHEVCLTPGSVTLNSYAVSESGLDCFWISFYLRTMNRNSRHMLSSFAPPRTIALVGLMGAGKTSIGKRLAQILDLPFYDSDSEIEKAAGRSCKEVFEMFGEEEFRQGERRVIARLLDMPIHILSTGGGAFVHDVSRQLIKEKAISVWLKADLKTLLSRVSRRNDRPLLDGENRDEVLEQLIEERYPIYSHADICVETFHDESASRTVERVIHVLMDYVEKYQINRYTPKDSS